MKTILQIANEIGVSKQAVYKRVKGSLYTEVYPYIHTVDGIMYIDVDGELLVKQAFAGKSENELPHTYAHTEVHTDTPMDIVLKQLEATIDILKTQLEEKDKQLQTKDKQIEQLQKLLDQQQQLQLVEQTKLLPMIQEKKSFWKKLFKK